MKQTLTLFFLLFFLYGHSQKLVEGIGKFKIHKTTISIIDSLKAEFGTIGSISSSHDELYAEESHTPNIYEIFCDTNNMDYIDGSPIYALVAPRTRVFFISEYTIANIVIKKIHLTFKDDILIDFSSTGSSEIGDALDIKYGMGETTVVNKDVHCTVTSTGGTVTYKAATYTKTWPANNFVCKSILDKKYNSDCEPEYTSIFYMSDEIAVKKVNAYTNEARKRYEARVKAEKAKKLSDF